MTGPIPPNVLAIIKLLTEELGLSYEDARKACNEAGNIFRRWIKAHTDAGGNDA